MPSKKATPVKSSLNVKEDEKSFERAQAELCLPDPSPEQATAFLKNIKKDLDNEPAASE